MVGYPNQKKTFTRRKQSTSNRGMKFEQIINESNEYYKEHDIAVIYKKPIPIQIVKVDYPSRSGAVITEAYYKVPSTTDYNGIYQGYYIDFEAKETQNKTSFPLSNIHPHQIEHLMQVAKHGGISFILVYWKHSDEIYLLEAKHVHNYFIRSKKGRKSITYDEMQQKGHLIPEGFAPRVPYLDVVTYLIQQKKA
ncbi:Holliday junction resolvase RecU [Candidatus Xianfuyuplasma coldseepsis]|uniref:Holliday junction resolvase RecU n=1 Tax=Candidatus Xianfuyuplasma coldseepsis TaxID=2782163 RepID=A0A7L7KT79_9MOLU|nr:Holliday junction resolvase RecU [Xianfuyuplasma coldseepsis]QMS85815.1 Holliday junction resolvase RecU [Xianfuyuplasma coldseepsis]